MRVFFFVLLVKVVSSQTTAMIDPFILSEIFDAPLTQATGTASTAKEPVIVSSTAGNTVFVTHKKEDQNCQCVPFYLCDGNNVGTDVNNVDITGYGVLDVRLEEDDVRLCQESVEICCTVPSSLTRPKPQPNPAKVKGCGYRNPKGLGATFTYANSQFGEFPWVVALLDSKNYTYLGVGVLIHPEVVMTAAHIATNYAPYTLKIRAGEWDTQTQKEIFAFQEREAKEIYIHSDYEKKDRRSNNIALLRLERPLEFSEYINAICMPEQDEVFDSYRSCIANGWGKDIFGKKGRFSVILKKVELNIVPYTRCSSLLKRTRLGSRFKLHDSFLCAGGEEGEDTCEGDGGAPLACPIGNDQYKLTGLVAWGIGCGQKDVPGVYTNVPRFRQWVDQKMEEWGLPVTSYKIS